jgi:hypothetical protein
MTLRLRWTRVLVLRRGKSFSTHNFDPQPGVPKNYKDLVRRNDPLWIQSLNDELENFIKREAWELMLRSKLPKKRRTLRTRWIFKEKADRTKKSRNVVRGYEQEPGVDFVESFSPLATNTTINVALATLLEEEALDEDWIAKWSMLKLHS